MKGRIGLGAVVGLALAACLAASPAAATVCDAGCNLTVTPISPGETSISGFFQTSGNDVTSISGMVTGTAVGSSFSEDGSITGLVTSGGGTFVPPSSTSGDYFTYSNTWNGSTFDNNGLLFSFDTGNYGNLYNVAGVNYLSLWLPDGNSAGGNFIPGEMVTLDVSAVPLPSTLSLFGAGLLGLGFISLRRKRQNAGFNAIAA